MSLRMVLRPNAITRLNNLVNKGHRIQQIPTASYRMSMVPYIMREMLRDLERPLYDQHFGLGLRPSHLLDHNTSITPLISGYLRPWRLRDLQESGVSNVINNKDTFQVSLDVQQFKPDELTVKVVDNFVVVEGKHEERSDEHGFISRQFSRRYQLPDDVDMQTLQSALSSDGVLQLSANKKPESEKDVRAIPITQTNAPALKQEKTAEEPEKEKVKSKL